MLPDLLVADQPIQATIGPATAEKGVWIKGEENGENLSIGEAVQPRHVLLTAETAVVGLRNIIIKTANNFFFKR